MTPEHQPVDIHGDDHTLVQQCAICGLVRLERLRPRDGVDKERFWLHGVLLEGQPRCVIDG